jgi:sialate O-acetylesterase
MVTALDVGEEDIHPRNKRDVGLRLSRTALRHVYGRKDVVAEGPLFRGMTVSGHTVTVAFEHADGGLVMRGSTLRGFAVAGEDRVFHWAEGRIVDDTIQLHSPHVPQPVAVRYGWANNPEVNLYNGAGLPAYPFRTDNWTGAAP